MKEVLKPDSNTCHDGACHFQLCRTCCQLIFSDKHAIQRISCTCLWRSQHHTEIISVVYASPRRGTWCKPGRRLDMHQSELRSMNTNHLPLDL